MYRIYMIIFMVLGVLENVLQLKLKSRSKRSEFETLPNTSAGISLPTPTLHQHQPRTKDTRATYRGVAGRNGSEKRGDGRG